MSTNDKKASIVEIYLDQDGVIANFTKAIDEKKTHLHGLEKKIWSMVPELNGADDLTMKAYFAGKQTDENMVAAKKIYNIFRAKFYQILGEEGFFFNLEPLPGAQELITGVARVNGGKLPNILTAPVQSAHCEPEKKKWMEHHFGGMYNQFICQKNKTEYSQPTAILIDDLTKNTKPWDEAGGFAILYAGDVAGTLEQVAEFIQEVNKL